MTFLFFVLIIIACAVLAFFVLIQNPKGGGLAGSLSGIGTQMMGAKQSTDIVEKGTWITATAVLVFTLLSFVLTPKNTANPNEKTRSEKVNTGVQAPLMPQAQTTQPAPTNASAPATGETQQTTAPAQTQPAPAKQK